MVFNPNGLNAADVPLNISKVCNVIRHDQYRLRLYSHVIGCCEALAGITCVHYTRGIARLLS